MNGRRAARAAASLALAATALTPLRAGAQGHVLGYRELDGTSTALSIFPPGQGRHPSTPQFLQSFSGGTLPHNGNQRSMYESLVRGAPALAPDGLASYFKDASFGIAPGKVARTYSPPLNAGTTILRDADFDVPRVYGATRADVFYGAGYVAAEDRLFVMDVVRHLARGRLSELLGASAANMALDRAQRAVVDYSEQELEAMAARLVQLDPVLGTQAIKDLEDHASGVNAYIVQALADPTKLPAEYPVLQLVPKPWRITDSVALATLVGGMFSPGGAGQLANAKFLSALEAAGHTPADARAIFDDFGFAEEPEAPTTTDDPYPLNADLGPVDPEAVALPDRGTVIVQSEAAIPEAADGPFGPIHLWNRSAGIASNALLVSKHLSETGRPLAVMGPQISYWTPEVMMEIELHGPGVHARGISLPGMGTAVLLGRGTDYAWSLTTAIADHADIRAVRLCDPSGGPPAPSSTWYLDDGTCKEMVVRADTFAAKPSLGGTSTQVVVSWPVQRTRHGLVAARGSVAEEPVAFVRERSSYMKESDVFLTYAEIHDPDRIDGVSDLQHAFRWYTLAFNIFIAHRDGVGFVTAGKYPTLANGVDPDLPFWGDSRWDWEGMLPYEQHPRDIDPAKGYIVNWNNKQAPMFRAADSYHSWGPIHRSQLLEDQVLAAAAGDGKVSLTELVRAMALPATQDLRGRRVLPLALEVIGSTGSARQDAALDLLRSWSDNGAHRRDLNGDGRYDEGPAVALMNALWAPLLEEMFKPALGSAFGAVHTIQDNAPGPIGSAYATGWYGHAHKELSAVLGKPIVQPFSRSYCGGGDASACRAALVRALDRALATVESQFGPNPSAWRADESADSLRFSSVGVLGQPPMPWQNRPTFQHVIEF